MKNYTDNPLWYKEIEKNQIWKKRTKNKNIHDYIKILSVVNKKDKKYVKVELPNGKRAKVDPGTIFYNFMKDDKC